MSDISIVVADEKELTNIINSNLNSIARNYIAIGFYLKQARDTNVLADTDYENVWDYACKNFNISKSNASRIMSINDRFSKDGNSIFIDEKYKNYSKSKLQEMIYLTDDQLEVVSPEMTTRELRSMHAPEKEDVDNIDKNEDEQLPGQMDIEDYAGVVPEEDETVATSQQNNDYKMDIQEDGHLEELKKVECDGKCFYCDNTKCNGYQDPREKCTYNLDISCNMRNHHKVALDMGIACESDCCNRCENKDCGVRCYSSKKSNSVELDQEDVESISLKTTETESEKIKVAKVTSSEVSAQDDDKPSVPSITIDDVLEYHKNLLDNMLRHPTPERTLKKQKIIVCALANMKCETELYKDNSYDKKEQEPLPLLKNNDQRSEFIGNYERWPLWMTIPQIGEKYYRYELNEGVAIVVKDRLMHSWKNYKESKETEYGSSPEYYLTGVKTEWNNTGVNFKKNAERTFNECKCSKTDLVNYLKQLQKEGK